MSATIDRSACEAAIPLLGPFADGALEADDRRAVDEHLPGCAACQRRLQALQAQGALLRAHLAAASSQTDLSRFSDGVFTRLDALEAARPSLWTRLSVRVTELWDTRQRLTWAGLSLAGASAIAAAVLVSSVRPPATAPAGRGIEVASSDVGADIQSLEVTGASPAVIELPGHATVIWLENDAPDSREAHP